MHTDGRHRGRRLTNLGLVCDSTPAHAIAFAVDDGLVVAQGSRAGDVPFCSCACAAHYAACRGCDRSTYSSRLHQGKI